MNSTKVNTKMYTIFMSSKSSKTSDLQKLLLGLRDKIHLEISDTYVP